MEELRTYRTSWGLVLHHWGQGNLPSALLAAYFYGRCRLAAFMNMTVFWFPLHIFAFFSPSQQGFCCTHCILPPLSHQSAQPPLLVNAVKTLKVLSPFLYSLVFHSFSPLFILSTILCPNQSLVTSLYFRDDGIWTCKTSSWKTGVRFYSYLWYNFVFNSSFLAHPLLFKMTPPFYTRAA